MNLNDYQLEALRTAPDQGQQGMRIVAALGLAGEVGEFVEMVKKEAFHGKPLDIDKAGKEIGDVLWYLSLAAESVGLKLADIAAANIKKLQARYPDGFVHGGGNRKDDGS
jgi:NTP pyrophosphatase (non-canonical NTP hydrolase)